MIVLLVVAKDTYESEFLLSKWEMLTSGGQSKLICCSKLTTKLLNIETDLGWDPYR